MTGKQLPAVNEKWQSINPATGDVMTVTVTRMMSSEPPSVMYRRVDAHVARVPLADFLRTFRKVS